MRLSRTVPTIPRHVAHRLIGVAANPGDIENDVSILDQANAAQTLLKRLNERAVVSVGGRTKRQESKPDRTFTLLLRARRERPRGRCAAEQRDELAPLHSITSSARPMSGSGNARPRVLAVFRLTTNSTFVDC